MIKEYVSYLKDNPEGYWFKRKLYGWGWTPATWQGRSLILGYVVLICALSFSIDENSSSKGVWSGFILPLVLLTSILIYFCYKKGEKPKWQWGIPKKDK